MLMPDVTAILDDPEIGGGQPFEVIRNVSVRSLGGYTKTPTIYEATGNIQPVEMSNQPSTAEDLLNQSIVVYSTFSFQRGSNSGESIVEADIIKYDDLYWRVTSVDDWSKWGYSRANATRIMDIIPEPEPEPVPDSQPATNEG